MTYSVGDKVRSISDIYTFYGQTGIITSIMADGTYVRYDNFYPIFQLEGDIMKEEANTKFKVGTITNISNESDRLTKIRELITGTSEQAPEETFLVEVENGTYEDILETIHALRKKRGTELDSIILECLLG